MIRSVASVLGGFSVWTVLWLGSNAVVAAAVPSAISDDGSVHGTGVLLLMFALSVVFSVIAGYVLGLIARGSSMKCAWALGIIQLTVGVFVQAQYWDKMPLWYHLSFLIMLLPAILIGATLRLRKIEPAVLTSAGTLGR